MYKNYYSEAIWAWHKSERFQPVSGPGPEYVEYLCQTLLPKANVLHFLTLFFIGNTNQQTEIGDLYIIHNILCHFSVLDTTCKIDLQIKKKLQSRFLSIWEMQLC